MTITAYYFIERYPVMTYSEITEDDVRTSLLDIEPLVEWLRDQFDDDESESES